MGNYNDFDFPTSVLACAAEAIGRELFEAGQLEILRTGTSQDDVFDALFENDDVSDLDDSDMNEIKMSKDSGDLKDVESEGHEPWKSQDGQMIA